MTAARSGLWDPVGKSLSKGDLGKMFAKKLKKKIIKLVDDSLNYFKDSNT